MNTTNVYCIVILSLTENIKERLVFSTSYLHFIRPTISPTCRVLLTVCLNLRATIKRLIHSLLFELMSTVPITMDSSLFYCMCVFVLNTFIISFKNVLNMCSLLSEIIIITFVFISGIMKTLEPSRGL